MLSPLLVTVASGRKQKKPPHPLKKSTGQRNGKGTEKHRLKGRITDPHAHLLQIGMKFATPLQAGIYLSNSSFLLTYVIPFVP